MWERLPERGKVRIENLDQKNMVFFFSFFCHTNSSDVTSSLLFRTCDVGYGLLVELLSNKKFFSGERD